MVFIFGSCNTFAVKKLGLRALKIILCLPNIAFIRYTWYFEYMNIIKSSSKNTLAFVFFNSPGREADVNKCVDCELFNPGTDGR